MEDFTHAFCVTCKTIQPVTQENLTGPDTSGQFVGGNLICNGCRSILATIYKRVDDGNTKIIPPPGSI